MTKDEFPDQPELPPKERAEWQIRLRDIRDAATPERATGLFTNAGSAVLSLSRDGVVSHQDEQLMRATLMRVWAEACARLDDA